MQQSIDAAQSNVDNAIRRRNEIDENIRGQEGLLQAAANDAERNRIRDVIEGMRRERRDVNDDLRVAQEQLPRLTYQMNVLRSELGGRWGSSW